MSSFYDDASLVVIPSGYKTSKVYAEKPTDGSGDLAFTRTGDTATRVNSAGLIEKVRTNLLLQSQTLSVGATWIPYSGTTVTADAIAAPDGTLTADRIAGTSAAFRGIRQSISSSAVPHTFSVYLKSATGSATTARIWVDSGVTVVNVTTDWQRFSVTATTAASFDVQISTAVSSAIDVYAWGAQVETTDFGATAYIPTLTAAVSTGPTANVPRLDYLGSTCGKLLLEPQRTNKLTQSNSLLAVSGTTVTKNDAVSPEGYTNASRISGTTGYAYAGASNTVGSNVVSTFSAFVKYKQGVGSASIGIAGPTMNIYLNISGFSANTISVAAAPINGVSGATVGYTSYGNGWFRVFCTATFTQSPAYQEFQVSSSNTEFWYYGGQIEDGAYATSYIPTLAASATRGADACSKTGISSLIGQTEGTLFVDLSEVNDLDFPEITIDNNNNTDRIVLTRSSGGNWGIFVASSAAATYAVYSTTSSTSGKFALAYSSAGYVLYRNGVQIVTGTYDLPTALSAIRFNGRSTSDFFANKKVAQALLFKTRLTNAQLAELTTL